MPFAYYIRRIKTEINWLYMKLEAKKKKSSKKKKMKKKLNVEKEARKNEVKRRMKYYMKYIVASLLIWFLMLLRNGKHIDCFVSPIPILPNNVFHWFCVCVCFFFIMITSGPFFSLTLSLSPFISSLSLGTFAWMSIMCSCVFFGVIHVQLYMSQQIASKMVCKQHLATWQIQRSHHWRIHISRQHSMYWHFFMQHYK